MAMFARQTLSLQRHINVRNCCFDRYFALPGKYRIFIVSIGRAYSLRCCPRYSLPKLYLPIATVWTLKFLFSFLPYPWVFLRSPVVDLASRLHLPFSPLSVPLFFFIVPASSLSLRLVNPQGLRGIWALRICGVPCRSRIRLVRYAIVVELRVGSVGSVTSPFSLQSSRRFHKEPFRIPFDQGNICLAIA